MENDDAMVGRILSRREAISLAAAGGVGLVLGKVPTTAASHGMQEQARREVKLVASPAVTEGPFFVDEKLERSDLVAGGDRKSVVDGVPLALAIKIYTLGGAAYSPLEGVTVDIWHADAAGVYSDESHPMNHENTAGQKWLRGYQKTDANGLVRFRTIVPGWYAGRTAHIHFKVRKTVEGKTKEFTSQLFFDDAFADRIFSQSPYRPRGDEGARNTNDGIYQESQVDGTVAGEHLMLDVSPAAKGYSAKFAVALTEHSLRTPRPHGPGGPGGFGGPPPGFDPPPISR